MLSRASAAALGVTLALLSGCADDLLRVVPGGEVTTSVADARHAARLVSEYRRSNGLGPVEVDDDLNDAASDQARAVAEAGRLSHGDFAGRMSRYGIKGAAAENLTAGSDTVAGAVARWRNSPSHDANLLLPGAGRIGLARADSPGRGYKRYWALVLAP